MSRAQPALRAALAASIVAVFVAACTGPAKPDGGASPSSVHPTATPQATSPNAPPVPVRGAYFGAWARQGAFTQPNQIAALDTLQGQLGRHLDIVHTYLTWQGTFPTTSTQLALNQGSMLLVSWVGIASTAVNSGTFDAAIKQRALEFKAIHKPIFLEWRWEMDRPNLRGFSGTPAEFIAAWKHVRAIFTQQHVNSVAWVWCPTAKGFAPGGDAAAYYPGNNEVDWTCADAYPGPGAYRSFADVTQPFFAWASHHPQPIMIGEFGVPQRYTPTQRSQWLDGVVQTVRANAQVRALVYFDSDPSGAAPLNSLKIEPGTAAMRALQQMADSTYFNPRRLPVAKKLHSRHPEVQWSWLCRSTVPHERQPSKYRYTGHHQDLQRSAEPPHSDDGHDQPDAHAGGDTRWPAPEQGAEYKWN